MSAFDDLLAENEFMDKMLIKLDTALSDLQSDMDWIKEHAPMTYQAMLARKKVV